MDIRDGSGATNTQFAASGGNIECVKFCLQNGGGEMDTRDNFGTIADIEKLVQEKKTGA